MPEETPEQNTKQQYTYLMYGAGVGLVLAVILAFIFELDLGVMMVFGLALGTAFGLLSGSYLRRDRR